jgi:chorismate synthase
VGSVFGNILRTSVFGESHGPGIGAVIDGMPPGEAINADELALFMARRAPGQSKLTTQRREPDQVRFLSGVMDGRTTGAPLTVFIENTNQHSGDYKGLTDTVRPSHADYTAAVKYRGYADMRGSGHFSGRLTAPLCAAGGMARQILRRQGIEVGAQLLSVGQVRGTSFDPLEVSAKDFARVLENPLPTLDPAASAAMAEEIDAARVSADSVGGVIQGAAIGLPVGLGDPMANGLENRLAAALFAIPGCKGVDFGSGFDAAAMRGSDHNDPFAMTVDGKVTCTSNHAGGILGGISTGLPIMLRCAMKPTASIGIRQHTISLKNHENAVLSVVGRHDPCIAIRAVPVVEAVMALTLLDLLLEEGYYEKP